MWDTYEQSKEFLNPLALVAISFVSCLCDGGSGVSLCV